MNIKTSTKMTTRLKATKTWCEVCNTTRHDSKKCGKVIAYNMILFKYLKVIHFDPYSVTNTYNGERYEKQFLKYAVSYLRKNGCYDPESDTRVSVDFEMVTKPNYNTLVAYFNLSLHQIRVKIRELRNESNKCPICLDTISKEATVTECGHKFCTECINMSAGKQLSSSNYANCPCCRRTTIRIHDP
jgi:hypothetical protein